MRESQTKREELGGRQKQGTKGDGEGKDGDREPIGKKKNNKKYPTFADRHRGKLHKEPGGEG